jgi:hypothetical protein
MGVLMLPPVNDLDEALAVDLVPLDETTSGELVEKLAHRDAVVWQDLGLKLPRAVVQATITVGPAP